MPTLETAIFLLCAVVIAVAGTKLARSADWLADATGLGEAFTGALLLGATTSLPGITASVTAAASQHPVLSVSNALGGIAAQTAFLAIGDIAYRRANLEHAAASVPNMMSGVVLTVLLAIILLAMTGPEITFFGVHVATPILFIVYGMSMWLIRRAYEYPMWIPRRTSATRMDVPETEASPGQWGPMLRTFVISAVAVIVAGWVLTRSAQTIARDVGWTESLMGGVFVAVTTSLPELVTSVAAVRQGALTLAVGGVLGGNAFDTLFAAVADIAYREGSIYHAVTPREQMLIGLGIVMTGTLLLGLLFRERRGFANIGFESACLIGLYALGVVLLAM